MITLKNIDVTFKNKAKTIQAVQDVSLEIKQGEVYGIVGYSGAGKSTLVRVMNYLQVPTKGSVIINNQDLGALNSKGLRAARKKIGMIFQHFNLMEARTVFDNVSYPLRGSALSKSEKTAKVTSLLELVGISDKAQQYPSQLSGGQKQRVAIARALANDPEVLLCDEATSALDPKTTVAILDLLKELNQRLNLTIVLITHEMQVVREICHKVAVMEDGRVIEAGEIVSIFSEPEQALTRDFIQTANHLNKAIETIGDHPAIVQLKPTDKLVHLSYVGSQTSQPLIARLYSTYQVEANILYGDIDVINQTPIGNLIVILAGDSQQITAGIAYLKEHQVKVTEIKLPQPANQKNNQKQVS